MSSLNNALVDSSLNKKKNQQHTRVYIMSQDPLGANLTYLHLLLVVEGSSDSLGNSVIVYKTLVDSWKI
jgi:hypothetical protein